jgi:hypothetical protein
MNSRLAHFYSAITIARLPEFWKTHQPGRWLWQWHNGKYGSKSTNDVPANINNP